MGELTLFSPEQRAQLVARLATVEAELSDPALNSLSAFSEVLLDSTRQRRAQDAAAEAAIAAAPVVEQRAVDGPTSEDPLDRAALRVHLWAAGRDIEQRGDDSGLSRPMAAHICSPPKGTVPLPPGVTVDVRWLCDCGQSWYIDPGDDA